jgi:hypothetical protein
VSEPPGPSRPPLAVAGAQRPAAQRPGAKQHASLPAAAPRPSPPPLAQSTGSAEPPPPLPPGPSQLRAGRWARSARACTSGRRRRRRRVKLHLVKPLPPGVRPARGARGCTHPPQLRCGAGATSTVSDSLPAPAPASADGSCCASCRNSALTLSPACAPRGRHGPHAATRRLGSYATGRGAGGAVPWRSFRQRGCCTCALSPPPPAGAAARALVSERIHGSPLRSQPTRAACAGRSWRACADDLCGWGTGGRL